MRMMMTSRPFECLRKSSHNPREIRVCRIRRLLNLENIYIPGTLAGHHDNSVRPYTVWCEEEDLREAACYTNWPASQQPAKQRDALTQRASSELRSNRPNPKERVHPHAQYGFDFSLWRVVKSCAALHNKQIKEVAVLRAHIHCYTHGEHPLGRWADGFTPGMGQDAS